MESPPQEPGQEGQGTDPAADPEPPAVEPTEGDQGQPAEQTAQPATGDTGDEPKPTSPPPAEGQSGTPDIPDGSNAGVQPAEGEGVEGDGDSDGGEEQPA